VLAPSIAWPRLVTTYPRGSTGRVGLDTFRAEPLTAQLCPLPRRGCPRPEVGRHLKHVSSVEITFLLRERLEDRCR
jgi:hypothetical protein